MLTPTPLIPAFRMLEAGGSLEFKAQLVYMVSSSQPRLHGETLSQDNKKKTGRRKKFKFGSWSGEPRSGYHTGDALLASRVLRWHKNHMMGDREVGVSSCARPCQEVTLLALPKPHCLPSASSINVIDCFHSPGI